MKNVMNDLEFEALNADILGEGEWIDGNFVFNGETFRYIPEEESQYGCPLMEHIGSFVSPDMGES